MLLGLLAATAMLAIAFRDRSVGCAVRTGEGVEGAHSAPYGTALFQGRFATLAGWLALLYLILPEFRGGYLIAERVAPLAAMLAVVALPPPAAGRRRLVAALVAGVLVFQFGQTLSAFLRFRAESAGLTELLAGTEPGQNLAGLIFERESASWRGVPVYLHFPAYYQADEGGAHPLLLRRAVPDLGAFPAGRELGRPAAGMERLEPAVLRLRAPRRAVPLLPRPRRAGGRRERLRGGPRTPGAGGEDGGGVVAVRAKRALKGSNP